MSATTTAPPDSASIFPTIVPSPMMTAMEPSTPPTPSAIALPMDGRSVPLSTPTKSDAHRSAMKAFNLKRAMRMTRPTIATRAISSRTVLWLMG